MRQSKNSKEVQGTGTAQQLHEQFNIATRELFQEADSSCFRKTINNLLSGWLSSDLTDLTDRLERVNIYDFFSMLSTHFEKTGLISDANMKETFPIELYEEILWTDLKTCKERFNEVAVAYIQSDLADNNEARSLTYYLYRVIKKHVIKIHKTKRKLSELNT